MKTIARMCCVAALLALTTSVVGCQNDEGAAAAAEDDVITSTDASFKKELAAAIEGLETGGSEGDPDAYEIADFKLRKGETMTEAVLLARLHPKLDGLNHDDASDMIAGLDESPIDEAWKDLTADPSADDFDDDESFELEKAQVAKWRNVKKLFDTKLTHVKYFDMGYRSSPTGSLETGAVAHVIVGQTASGRVIAIWGIDIWT